jgi:hypothetical protein
MSNAAFTPFLEGILSGEIDLDTATIKASYVRGYTFSAAHKFVSDVTGAGGTLNGTSAALANKTVVGGVFDADDTTVTTTASAVNHYILVFQSSAKLKFGFILDKNRLNARVLPSSSQYHSKNSNLEQQT